jgi:CDP-glycerol glycerophosphotransferase (TagB/SpsB family)
MAGICFLFNHDQVHQVAHSLPIALALAKRTPGNVTLAVTTPELERHVRILAAAAGDKCHVVRLNLQSKLSNGLNTMLGRLVPARKLLIYRENLEFFRRVDILVASEKTSLLLKTRYGLGNLRIVHTRHGAGDRAIGFGRESAAFDLVLVSGPKIARRLVAEAGVAADRIAVVGYPKFDLYSGTSAPSPFADSSKPVVLYAPHPSPRLSSWHRMGEAVLEAFHRSDRYNLIFAPHVMLFARPWTITVDPPAVRRIRKPDRQYREADNIHIDLGSPPSTDMSYTNLADVYIGDVSSQIYEFLHRPRPCLHLNAHGVVWKDDRNYAHWRSGPVIGRGEDILAGVDRAIATHGEYLTAQRELFDDTFSLTEEPSAERAAKAILELVDRDLSR